MFSSKDDYGNSEVSELIEAQRYWTLVDRLWEEGLMPDILEATAGDYPLKEFGYNCILEEDFLTILYCYTELTVTDDAANRIKCAINDEKRFGCCDDYLFIGNPNASRKPPNDAK